MGFSSLMINNYLYTNLKTYFNEFSDFNSHNKDSKNCSRKMMKKWKSLDTEQRSFSAKSSTKQNKAKEKDAGTPTSGQFIFKETAV